MTSRALLLSNVHEWKSSASTLHSISIEWMRHGEQCAIYVLFFFFRSNTRLGLIRDAVRRDVDATEGGARTRGDCDLLDQHRGRVRCNMWGRWRWRRLTNERTSFRAFAPDAVRHGSRLAKNWRTARQRELTRSPLFNRRDQPTDRPNRRWRAGTDTILVPVSPAPPQPPSPYHLGRPFGACIPIYSRIYPRSGSTLSGSRRTCLGTCRTFYLHAPFFCFCSYEQFYCIPESKNDVTNFQIMVIISNYFYKELVKFNLYLFVFIFFMMNYLFHALVIQLTGFFILHIIIFIF